MVTDGEPCNDPCEHVTTCKFAVLDLLVAGLLGSNTHGGAARRYGTADHAATSSDVGQQRVSVFDGRDGNPVRNPVGGTCHDHYTF